MIKPRIKPGLGTPYGGQFELNLPEKAIVGYGQDFETMLRRVISYRQANGMPVGLGVREEVEAAACAKYQDMCFESDDRVPSSHQLHWEDVLRGTKVMAQLVGGRIVAALGIGESPLVTQEEAERRAAICEPCPFNQQFTQQCGSTLCGALLEMANDITGNRTTPRDANLKSCQICKCFLRPAVHVRLDIQIAGLTEDERKQFAYARETAGCWKTQ